MNTMLRCWLLCSFFLLGCIQECWQLVIKNVTIPSMVKANDTDHVILDCDYDLEDTPSKGLVVKWFFNTDEVAYQWIYGRKPLAGDTLSNYVELNYPASDDPYTMYRAIKLNNPDIELSGEYRCVISTFADEKSASGSMIVYSTEKKFDLIYTKKTIDDKDGVEITCLAEGLYPQPTLNISIEGVPENQTFDIIQRVDGLYDVLSRTTFLDEELPDITTISCLLHIPEANYNVSHETVYYPRPPTTSTATTKLLHKMETQTLNDSEPGNGGGNLSGQLSINILHYAIMPLIIIFNYLQPFN
ncbi:uncharacterized protein LOC100868573 isoform X1 [Apis florea]|uniref:uncharacterized protein LOC100868573 isoform X1 n=1 Tax=Apis florea TaxID=7463 RepID=UPI000252B2CC|nr:uncharacterized protein LOC100868573 isoform X1 [Apis florea]